MNYFFVFKVLNFVFCHIFKTYDIGLKYEVLERPIKQEKCLKSTHRKLLSFQRGKVFFGIRIWAAKWPEYFMHTWSLLQRLSCNSFIYFKEESFFNANVF